MAWCAAGAHLRQGASHLAAITIVGLGPGDPSLLTRQAWDVLQSATELYLRTSHHPAVAELPAHLVTTSFDAIYDTADHFEAVYEEIARRVLALGVRPQGVVYGVPGDPSIGEATTWLIRHQAHARGMAVHVVHGVSFVEPVCLAVGIDPLAADGLQILDAMVVAACHAPPFDPSRPALLAQCYSRALASDVKLTLLHSFAADHPVTLVQSAGTTPETPAATVTVPLYELDRQAQFDHLTTVYVPPVGSFASHSRLQEIVAHLRAPDGCPWDREQDLQTLRKDLLEETYELLEALDDDDDGKISEELGDVSLIVAMLAQIAAEEGRFLWPQVMEQVSEKLIRRHPHVFGDVQVSNSEEVVANWARIKQAEARNRPAHQASILASVPRALPALTLASKYQSRLARAGITPDVTNADPVGRSLWTLVAEARAAGVDAETTLREVCRQVAWSIEGDLGREP